MLQRVSFIYTLLKKTFKFSCVFLAGTDFSIAPQTVTLSATQLRDCVIVGIVDDNVLDPGEVFSVTLTTNSVGATVRDALSSAQVTINDNDEGKYRM